MKVKDPWEGEDRLDVLMIYPLWAAKGWRMPLQRMLPPLGVLSIAAYVESHGFKVGVLDLHVLKMGPKEFADYLLKVKPKFVGITVLTPHVYQVHWMSELCKKNIPDVQVIVGGTHAEL